MLNTMSSCGAEQIVRRHLALVVVEYKTRPRCAPRPCIISKAYHASSSVLLMVVLSMKTRPASDVVTETALEPAATRATIAGPDDSASTFGLLVVPMDETVHVVPAALTSFGRTQASHVPLVIQTVRPYIQTDRPYIHTIDALMTYCLGN